MSQPTLHGGFDGAWGGNGIGGSSPVGVRKERESPSMLGAGRDCMTSLLTYFNSGG